MAITSPYILASINFYLTPFYSSHASDSNVIWKNHVRQNSWLEQVLHSLDSIKTHTPTSSLHCQVSSCNIRTCFILKGKLFNNLSFHICDLICKNPEQSCIFKNSDFCIMVFYIPKAFFCSNIKSKLQIDVELQG